MKKIGIDISMYNGYCDFAKAKKSGVEFVIIRAVSGAKGGYIDKYFEYSYRECKKVGLPVGVYVASYLNIDRELALLKQCLKGKTFEYPIFYDLEDFSFSNNSQKKYSTSYIDKFCKEVESWGYYAGLYTNKAFYNSYVDKSIGKKYDLWIAHWNQSVNYDGVYPMHQYSNKGRFSGINNTGEGGVDVNYCFIDYPMIIKKNGLNGFTKMVQTEPVKEIKVSGKEVEKMIVVYKNDGDMPTALAVGNVLGLAVVPYNASGKYKDEEKIIIGGKYGSRKETLIKAVEEYIK